MLKKVLYLILAVAFVMGTHLIAHETENKWPSARPSASATASANEATASASLEAVAKSHTPTGDPTTLVGSGIAWARVKYYMGSDEDRAPDDENEVGRISLTLTATLSKVKSTDTEKQKKKKDRTDADVGVGVGGKKGKIGIDIGGSAEYEEENEEKEIVTITTKTVKEVEEDHETQKASVGGNENHFKSCFAVASYGSMPIDRDNDTYSPSFLEWLNPLW